MFGGFGILEIKSSVHTWSLTCGGSLRTVLQRLQWLQSTMPTIDVGAKQRRQVLEAERLQCVACAPSLRNELTGLRSANASTKTLAVGDS